MRSACPPEVWLQACPRHLLLDEDDGEAALCTRSMRSPAASMRPTMVSSVWVSVLMTSNYTLGCRECETVLAKMVAL